MEKTIESALFEQVEVNDTTLLDIPHDKTHPRIGDVGWTEYILSLLEDGEAVIIKDKKLPKAEALRRITTKVFGKIVKSKAHPPQIYFNEKGMISVVNHELIVDRYGDEGLKEVWGVADVREECLVFPFSQHVSSNASTKALGRAFRDMLELQVCVAEELNNIGELIVVNDPEDAGPAESSQKKAIQSLCRRMNIDVNKFINSGSNKHKNIDEVLKGTAKKLISILNGYQSGDNNSIPEEILL